MTRLNYPSARPIRGSEKLQLLQEVWLSCAGEWRNSTFYSQLKQSSTHRHKGARKWMTKRDISLKYGSEEVATQIIAHKEADESLKELRTCPP